MTGRSARARGGRIRLRGVRQNNLAGFDLDIPLRRMTVVTGPSGSGKSSLAFDTLYAEGQRRYIETFSPYARQFFDRMDKPRADLIDGIPPAIAIEQKNTVRTHRSTVGTMTDICDYMKALWPHFSRPRCPGCGDWIAPESPLDVWKRLAGRAGERIYIAFPSELSERLGPRRCLEIIRSQGFRRCLIRDRVHALDDLIGGPDLPGGIGEVEVVQDRLEIGPRSRSRVLEACRSAFSLGRGRLSLYRAGEGGDRVVREAGFSQIPACPRCGIGAERPSHSLFSFNSPLGACPRCKGLGRASAIDFGRAIDSGRSLEEGALRIWRRGHGRRSMRDLLAAASRSGIPADVPFGEMDPEHRRWVIEGDGEGWYGLEGYFEWLERQKYRHQLRAVHTRYSKDGECPACKGGRFRPEALLHQIDAGGPAPLSLPQFYSLTLRESLAIVEKWIGRSRSRRPDSLRYALEEARNRLRYLCQAGLSYLTLDRPTRTLSGGETERINLASTLGTGLVNTLFILDEPSVGLHAVDIRRLIGILHDLRDAGNTVVVVEHDESIVRAADHVVDLGPGSGAAGGRLVFSGPVRSLLRRKRSLTARFLNRTDSLDSGLPAMPVDAGTPRLRIRGATCRNLRDLSVDIPLGRLVGVTGVSGSGKTTLVGEVLCARLGDGQPADRDTEPRTRFVLERRPAGELPRAILVDQSPVKQSSRSVVSIYAGVLDRLRALLVCSPEARQAGLESCAFSFNSSRGSVLGRCEKCSGAGFERVEMQFLSDVYVRCPDCGGTRFCRQMREFKVDMRAFLDPRKEAPRRLRWSVTGLLEATVDEAAGLMARLDHPEAGRALAGLRLMQEVGLGYLQLGQSLHTLSGGESQRLKVVRILNGSDKRSSRSPSLFLFDEPTTGLHFSDIRTLLRMFRSLVAQGHGVVVIEHHLEFIRQTDWVVDLGPGAGAEGGRVVAEGPPGSLHRFPESVTGRLLGEG